MRLWEGQRFPREALRTRRRTRRCRSSTAGGAIWRAGPDFLDAIIADERGRLLKGDVELHVRASAFVAHGHHLDPRYDNLILHVVFHDDTGAPTLLSLRPPRRRRRPGALGRPPRRGAAPLAGAALALVGALPQRRASGGWPEVRETARPAGADALSPEAGPLRRSPCAARAPTRPSTKACCGRSATAATRRPSPAWPASFPTNALRQDPRPRRAAGAAEALLLGKRRPSPQPARPRSRRPRPTSALWRSAGRGTLGAAGAGALAAAAACARSNLPARRLAGFVRLSRAGPASSPACAAAGGGDASVAAPARRLAGGRRRLLAQSPRPGRQARRPAGRRPHRPGQGAGDADQRRAAVRRRLGRGARPRRPVAAGAGRSSCACPRPAPTAAPASWRPYLRPLAGAERSWGACHQQGRLYLYHQYCAAGECSRLPAIGRNRAAVRQGASLT